MQHIAVPAYFVLGPNWQRLEGVGETVSIVVPEASFGQIDPATNPSLLQQARDQFKRCRNNGQKVLGYVSTRNSLQNPQRPPRRPETEILPAIQRWHDLYPEHIDGIFFDEGPQWYDSAEQFYRNLLVNFKANHPGQNIVFLNAAQFSDRWVMEVADYVILWEERQIQYHGAYGALVPNAAGTDSLRIDPPPWWTEAQYTDRIVHIVWNCPTSTEMLDLIALSTDRKAGVVYVYDGSSSAYDHLPSYWDEEVQAVRGSHGPGTYDIVVEKALQDQQDLITRREHCSADPEKLATVGRALGHQVRIKRNDSEYALYTVSEMRQESPENVVRMGDAGLQRLGTNQGFTGTLDSQAPHPSFTDAEAEGNSEFVERLDDDGTNNRMIVIAPHGGNIEPRTDQQAEHVASRLVGRGVSSWRCKGWKQGGGAFDRWHITSTDINEASFPRLNSIVSRGFACAIAFHGFDGSDIVIGGTAPDSLKQEIKGALEGAIVGSGITVRIARPDENFNGDDPRNIVNRLSAGGANGIQIEQSLSARSNHWQTIADAVANVYGRVCLGIDMVAPVTTCAFSPVPNAQGWNNSDVTVTLQATDNTGGSGVGSIAYSLNGVQQPPEQKDTVTFQVATEGQNVIAYHAVDRAGNTETPDKTCTVRLDKTPPTITVVTPTDGATYTLDQQVFASYSCNDAGGSGWKSCTGTVPDGSPLDTSTYGPKTFTVTAEDNAGNKTTKTVTYNVFFNFTGFFPPIHENWPNLNRTNAGRTVPVKFSLGGNQGLDIFAQGYPKTEQISCNNPNVEAAGTDPTEHTGSGLTYDAGSDQYHYNWKTERGWQGTCRQLVVKLKDGSFHRANFQFT